MHFIFSHVFNFFLSSDICPFAKLPLQEHIAVVLHQNDEWKFTQEVKLLLSYIHICLQKTLSQKGLPKEKLDSPDIVRIVTPSLPAVVSFRDLSLV